MTDRDQVPALLLRIDNLIHVNATLSKELSEERHFMAEICARLENIERAHAVPLNYNVREAVSRLGGMSLDWGYRHLPKLVTPVSRDPLLFPIAKIEALRLTRQKSKEEKAG